MVIAALAFGLQDLGPLVWAQIAGGVVAIAALALLVLGIRRFRKPTVGDALDRLDEALTESAGDPHTMDAGALHGRMSGFPGSYGANACSEASSSSSNPASRRAWMLNGPRR